MRIRLLLAAGLALLVVASLVPPCADGCGLLAGTPHNCCKIKSELENWQKMKEAGSKKRTDKKLSKKAKAKQEAQANAEVSEKQAPAEETKTEETTG